MQERTVSQKEKLMYDILEKSKTKNYTEEQKKRVKEFDDNFYDDSDE